MNDYHTLDKIVEANLAPSVDWLARRLNSGEISGCKVGRKWLMSEEDIAEMLAKRRNPKRETIPGGFTKSSSRRRSA